MSLFSWIDDNIIQPIVNNPVGVIVNVGLMAMGVPPIYAAAAGGAANAAAKGGSTNDILKGAFVGGAMAYVGGASAAATARYGAIVSGAAGGAASAAAGAALTGQPIGEALKSGLVIGGITGAVYEAMTQAEAKAAITKEAMAKANASSDPIGTLIEEMDWLPSDTSTEAANAALQDVKTQQIQADITQNAQAYAQQQAAQQAGVATQNTAAVDSFLKSQTANVGNINELVNYAKTTANPTAALQDVMGWSNNNITAQAANQLISNPTAYAPVAGTLAPVTVTAYGAPPVATPVVPIIPSTVRPSGPSQAEIDAQRAAAVKAQQDTQAAASAKAAADAKAAQDAQIKAQNEKAAKAFLASETKNVTDLNALVGKAKLAADPAAALRESLGWGNNTITQNAINELLSNPIYSPTTMGATETVGTKVDLTGRAGMVGSESAVRGPLSAGSSLATPAQIDAGQATWNSAANAWEFVPSLAPVTVTGTAPAAPVPPTIIVPPTTGVPNTTPLGAISPVQPTTAIPSLPETTVTATQEKTPTIVVPPVIPTTGPFAGQTGTGTGTTPSLPEVTVTGTQEKTPTVVIPPTAPVAPITPVDNVLSEVVVTAKPETDDEPVVTPPPGSTVSPGSGTVVPPTVVIPPTTPEPTKPSTHYGTYTWGNAPAVEIPTGLNPGWIQPSQFYNATDPSQSHYYWGGHPYQPGPTFNQSLYNTVPGAPAVPWGQQQMFTQNQPYPITQYMPPQTMPQTANYYAPAPVAP